MRSKTDYKEEILSQLKALGTYKDAFDSVIDSLATILAQRDCVYMEFLSSGGEACIYKTQRDGTTNIVKNPLIGAWNDLNSQALAYWKELGLTVVSLKKITGDSPKEKRGGGLAEALKNLEV